MQENSWKDEVFDLFKNFLLFILGGAIFFAGGYVAVVTTKCPFEIESRRQCQQALSACRGEGIQPGGE